MPHPGRHHRRRTPRQTREAASFWLVVVLIAVMVAFLSYRVGRDWLGKRMAGLATSTGAPRIIAQSTDGSSSDPDAGAEAKAPKKAEVSLDDREPTEGERRKLADQGDLDEPQDGAEVNARDGDDAAGADDQAAKTGDEPDPDSADAGSGGGKFVVTAGSFADRANAERTMRTLSERGYQPSLQTVRRDGKTYQRVNVATVDSRGEADDLKAELDAEGLDAAVSPVRR